MIRLVWFLLLLLSLSSPLLLSLLALLLSHCCLRDCCLLSANYSCCDLHSMAYNQQSTGNLRPNSPPSLPTDWRRVNNPNLELPAFVLTNAVADALFDCCIAKKRKRHRGSKSKKISNNQSETSALSDLPPPLRNN